MGSLFYGIGSLFCFTLKIFTPMKHDLEDAIACTALLIVSIIILFFTSIL